MKERWWISNLNTNDVTGGTEKSGEKYCKILKLKYMSAQKLGVRDYMEIPSWGTAKLLDDIISGVPLEFLLYNSTNCWSKKPTAEKSVCICNENFLRESLSVKNDKFKEYKMQEWIYQQKSIKNADKILTVSRQEHDNLKEDLGIESDVLESSVNTDIFFPVDKQKARFELSLPFDKKTFLFVGRRHIRKGYDIILDLAKLHPECLFINIVGRQLDNSPSNIWEVGGVTDEWMNYYYNASDFVLAPSRYESFGLMFIEALATNTPIIGSRVGIAHDIPESHGTFIDDITVESFEKEINTKREFEPGRSLVEKRFSYNVMADNLRRIVA